VINVRRDLNVAYQFVRKKFFGAVREAITGNPRKSATFNTTDWGLK
jgi:hypothetical protein